MRYLIFICILFASCQANTKVQEGADKITWMSLEVAEAKTKMKPKPIFVMVHANWCPKCQRFQDETYNDPKVIKAINENFYPVMVNAHEPKDIRFRGKLFSNPHYDSVKGLEQMNSYHEVLFELGAKSVPSIVFLDSSSIQVGSEMGFKEGDELRSLINLYKS